MITTARSMERLKEHVGHDIVCTNYGDGTEISLECETCNEVLYSIDNSIKDETTITKDKFDSALKCLIDNGIDAAGAPIVLQALCYILCDEETEHLM